MPMGTTLINPGLDQIIFMFYNGPVKSLEHNLTDSIAGLPN